MGLSRACLLATVICGSLIASCAYDEDDSSSDYRFPGYSVFYQENGATSGTVPVDSTPYYDGDEALVLDNTGGLMLSGCSFMGWALDGISGSKRLPGQTCEVWNESLKLYAMWRPQAEVITSGDMVFVLDQGKLELWAAYGTNPTIDIPTEVGGYDVTAIGSRAFGNQGRPRDVIIPATVTTIRDAAFEGYFGLLSVTIPAGVTSIGKEAFSRCGSLRAVDLPAGVTAIDNYTFSGCSSLSDVAIPTSVTSIGEYAFNGCASLASVTIPLGVTELSEYAFKGCTSLSSVIIPASVKTMGPYLFYECSKLENVTIPDSVTQIDLGVFHSCTSLKEIHMKSAVPPTISYGAFYFIPDATKIFIPKGSTAAYNAKENWYYYSPRFVEE